MRACTASAPCLRSGDQVIPARQRAVAILVLLTGAARAGLVATDLALGAHERSLHLRLRWWRRTRSDSAGGRWMWLPRFRCRLLHVPGEQRGKLGVLRLERTHRALLPLQSCRFLAIDLFLGAHFELGENGDRLELDPIEHRREQLERLALVLEAIVL